MGKLRRQQNWVNFRVFTSALAVIIRKFGRIWNILLLYIQQHLKRIVFFELIFRTMGG